jgi:hypothetical protein
MTTEVQSHGFVLERELCEKVYGATMEEMKGIKYTSKMDLPGKFNRLDNCDLSIKTSCSPNAVCMADCLRVFDAVGSANNIHLTVIYYLQNDETRTKHVLTITEINLTDSQYALFGTVIREQLEELVNLVKSIPKKRKPTKEEYANMYSLRDTLQAQCGAIHLDIKCDSKTQRRLQCSFNRFQQFIEQNPSSVIERSNSNSFRGGVISSQIVSPRRVFKKVPSVAPPLLPE